MRRRRSARSVLALCAVAGASACGGSAADPARPAQAPVKPTWADSAQALVVGATPQSVTLELDVRSEFPARFDDVNGALRYPTLQISARGARIASSEHLETVPFTGSRAVDGSSSDTSHWRYAYRLEISSPALQGVAVHVRGCLPRVGCSETTYGGLTDSRRIQYPRAEP